MDKEVIPAVMPATFDELQSSALLVRHTIDTIQIDIMDGEYVKAISWPFSFSHQLKDIQHDEFALPLWEEMNYELDLMVVTPEKDLSMWLSLGASRIVFHYASVHDWNPISKIDQVMRNFVTVGVAITLHDPIEEVYKLLDDGIVDFVQIMGIARIGYQGEPFVFEVLELVSKLRQKYPKLPISVDGGVNTRTILQLSNAGVNRFVVGSAVFGGGIPAENIENLYDILDTVSS